MDLNFHTQQSYRNRVRHRLVEQIRSIRNKHGIGSSNVVLVMDIKTAFKISNVLKVSELVEVGITFIERLEVKRKKLDYHAIYFIEPTKTNIGFLLADFPQNEEKPQYKKVHILFTTFIQKSLLRDLAHSKCLLKRLAKNSIKQFYHSCQIIADNTISADLPYLSLGFSKDTEAEEDTRNVLGDKFMQILPNMKKINKIKIYYKKGANKVGERMALALQNSINRYLGIMVENKSQIIDKKAEQVVFLLVDRSVDTVSPLIHYFSYECLLFDLFDICFAGLNDLEDKGQYSYEEIQNKVYERYRYKHISQSLEKLPKQLDAVKEEIQSIKSKEDLSSFNIKELNNHVMELKSNIQMLDNIWTKFKSDQIQNIAELQQSLATGLTSEAVNTSSVKLLSQAFLLIKEGNLDREGKLRLALLCLSCIKFSKTDYQQLIDLFPLEDKRVLKNLISLGVSYDSSVKKSTKTITKQQQSLAKKRMQAKEMPLDRYTTIVQLVVPLFCNLLSQPGGKAKIDEDIFGHLSCQAIPDDSEEASSFLYERMVFGMVGGLSWTQISSLRNLPALKDITIIADSIINGKKFIQELGEIKHPGIMV